MLNFFFPSPKKSQEKARKLISKGDRLQARGQPAKAFKNFATAQRLDPDNPEIYDRLTACQQALSTSFTDEDFARSLTWTMKKQELLDPALKRLHAKLSPEWETITHTIFAMMQETNPTRETELIEKIVAYGDKALYPLIEYLLTVKKKVHQTIAGAP